MTKRDGGEIQGGEEGRQENQASVRSVGKKRPKSISDLRAIGSMSSCIRRVRRSFPGQFGSFQSASSRIEMYPFSCAKKHFTIPEALTGIQNLCFIPVPYWSSVSYQFLTGAPFHTSSLLELRFIPVLYLSSV